MESVPLEMDDIFEEEEDIDQVPQLLPDLPEAEHVEGQEQNEDETENKKVLDKLKGMKGASKNKVKRPMPKLDSDRLTGERGIPILPRIFKDVKLKGKGHEVEDLRVVMRYLEHWAHRLFPMMPFDEVLDRVERLGSKREVQTCIKKMRLDMPVLGTDTVSRGEGENEEGDTIQDHRAQQEPSAEDRFDALIQAEQELEAEMSDVGMQESTSGQQGASGRSGSCQPSAEHTSLGACEGPSASPALSAEMLERIALKRRLAMERRALKLGVPATPPQPVSGDTMPTNETAQDGGPLSVKQPDISSNQRDLPSNQPATASEGCVTGRQTPEQPGIGDSSVTTDTAHSQLNKTAEAEAEHHCNSGHSSQEMQSYRSDSTEELEACRSDPKEDI